MASLLINAVKNFFYGGGKNAEDAKDEVIDVDSIISVRGEQDCLMEAKFASLLSSCAEDEIVLRSVTSIFSNWFGHHLLSRFHILIPGTVPFDPDNDKLLLRGLDDNNSLAQIVEMSLKRSMRDNYLMVGCKSVKRSKVLGKSVKYKYQVVPRIKEPWYEQLAPENDAKHGLWVRVVAVPRETQDKYFDKFDDVILRDNSERRVLAKLACRYSLPSLVLTEGDGDLKMKVKQFVQVVKSHHHGMTIEQHGYQHETLLHNEDDCITVLRHWAQNFFKCLKENENRIEGSVSACLFYLSLYSHLPRLLPELQDDHLEILLNSLQLGLASQGRERMEVLSSLIKPDQRIFLSEMLEKAVQSKFCRENPRTVFVILPIVHHLRGYRQPATYKEALERQQETQYWGLYNIPLTVLRGMSQFSLDEIKELSKTDKLMKFSFLRSLYFDDFLSVLRKNESIKFFGLQPLLACSLTWLNRDEKPNVVLLSKAVKDFLENSLAQSRQQFNVDQIMDLCFCSRRFFKVMHNLDMGDGLRSSFEIVTIVHRHFKTEADSRPTDVFNFSQLAQFAGSYLDIQKTKIREGSI